MTVDATSLLAIGGGRIAPSLYAGIDNVPSILNGFLAKGYANALAVGIAAVDADDIATAWAYYSFYTYLAESMAARPSSVTLNDAGSQGWTSAQMALIDKRAAEWLLAYRELIDTGGVESPASSDGWASIKSLRYP